MAIQVVCYMRINTMTVKEICHLMRFLQFLVGLGKVTGVWNITSNNPVVHNVPYKMAYIIRQINESYTTGSI